MSNPTTATITPVSLAAAEARVRRALAKQGQTLHISRSERDRQDCGACYVTDTDNRMVASACTIEGLADELGVIAPGEIIATEVHRG